MKEKQKSTALVLLLFTSIKNNPRAMKLTCLYLMLILLSFSAMAEAQRVSVSFDNVRIGQVLDVITEQTGYSIAYSKQVVDLNHTVSIHLTDANVNTVLDQLLKTTPIAYEIKDGKIYLYEKKANTSVPQQTKKVTGTVLDAQGLSVIGATVIQKGSATNGTITDIDGNFSLEIPDNATLQISFIGFVTQDIPVRTATAHLNIVLKEDFHALDEVVVVGYGTQKKVNLTGAVTQITTEEMKDRPVSRMTQALQGVIPNLNITFGSGQPGSSGTLNIRGTTSINGGSPLVLIDGVPGDLDRINVADVETVSVLKDASASAIYGARAAFGVILVTTKQGKEGKFKIDYTNNFGWTTHAINTDFITSGYWNAKINDEAMYNALGNTTSRYTEEDYEELLARVNDKTEHPDRPWVVVKKNAAGQDMYRYYANFDWFNYFYSKYRPQQNHNISFTGATEKVRYLITGNYSQEEGIIKINPDVSKRYNFRAKIDTDITKWLTISSNTRYFRSTYDWHGHSTNFSKVTNDVTSSNPLYHAHPFYVPFNPDGTLTGYSGVNSYSIAYGYHAILENGKSKGERSNSEFATTFQAILKLAKGLTVTGNYTFTQDHYENYYRAVRVKYSKFPGIMENYAIGALNRDQLTQTMRSTMYHVMNLYANYETSLDKHNFKAMAGFNQELRTTKTLTGIGQELLSETLNDLNFSTAEEQATGGGEEWALRGAFYRLNYDYDGKYLLETSGRYDGTSRFPKDDRFGFFPSFSLGWRISEEAFFSPLKMAVNNLKLRYSYGTLGNQDVSTYAYISSMSAGTINYLVNDEKLTVVNDPSPVARALTWEKSITNNIGLDADFLNGRLTFSGDYYIRETKDMLTLSKTLPKVFGATEPKENAADLRTKGYELTVGWRDKIQVAGKPLDYNVTAILADNTSKITKFDNPNGLLSTYRVGQQLGEIWGYRYDGYFKTTEEAQEYAKRINQDKINKRRVQAPTAELKMLQAGDIKILDLNGDGIIDTGANTIDNPGDREIIGNETPRYSYGLSASANWNGIDLFVLFQGIGKQNWYPHLECQQFWQVYARPYGSFIPEGFQDKMWSPENPNAYFPRVIGYIAQNSELSVANDMYLQDLAYCKLRNLTIGYTLPALLTNKLKIDRLRVYISGENLFTWTKLDTDYIDPEETMNDPTARTYPMGKTYSFGVELSF